MKLSDAFPSNYLKVDDLNKKAVTLTISDVEMVDLGQGREKKRKLLLSFHKTEKQLVCNPTNAHTIEKLYGDETDDWINQRITLVPREVDFKGDMVWAIRVSLQKPATGPTTKAPAPPPEPEEFLPEPPEAGDESVPF